MRDRQKPIHSEPRLQTSTKRMLIAFVLLALLSATFCLASSARAYYYESEIDPRVIYTWEVVETTRIRADGTYFVVSKNPDNSHLIKYVLFKVYFPENRLLTGYAYYKGGELFVYELDYGGYRERECYFALIKPTPKEKKEIDSRLKPHLEPLEKKR